MVSSQAVQVGFLSNTRERLRLRTLRHKLLEEPSLHHLMELLKSYIALGDLEEARELSEWGLKQFPDSDAVRDVHRFASHERTSEIRKRTQDPAEREVGPEPRLDLARAYRTAGKDEEAARTLEDCVTRFPHYGRAHAELAEIYSQWFRSDLCSTDAIAAIRHYEEVIAADSADTRTCFAFAVLYLRIGALSRAKELLKQVVVHDSVHAVAASLLDVVSRMAENAEEEPIETLLVKIEERGQLMHEYPPEELAGKQARPQRLEIIGRLMEAVSAESIVEECFFIDHEKRLVGTTSTLTEMAMEMLPTAATAMRRMQLGSLLSFGIETDQRQILLQQTPDGNIGVRTAPGISPARAATVLRRHLEAYAGWRNK
jgi:tetratricopeptide (TPR) repeat protein